MLRKCRQRRPEKIFDWLLPLDATQEHHIDLQASQAHPQAHESQEPGGSSAIRPLLNVLQHCLQTSALPAPTNWHEGRHQRPDRRLRLRTLHRNR